MKYRFIFISTREQNYATLFIQTSHIEVHLNHKGIDRPLDIMPTYVPCISIGKRGKLSRWGSAIITSQASFLTGNGELDVLYDRRRAG